MTRECKGAIGRGWDDATPDEIRDARIQLLEEGLSWLKECVSFNFAPRGLPRG